MEGQETSKNPFTILIIDDEIAIRELLEFDFKSKGYTVLTAGNGEEGLKLATQETVDLIITDLRMPEMGGVKVISEIRKIFKGPMPSIIVITGHFGITLEQAMASGACHLLNKPFSRKELLSAVEHALQPFQERWKSNTLESTDPLLIDVEIEDFSQTEKEGKLVLGWGGFFLYTPDVVPEEGQPIHFKLKIIKPETITLEGGGKVVWRRLQKKQNLLPGIGVEIAYFTADCLDQAIKWLNADRINNYIPNSPREP